MTVKPDDLKAGLRLSGLVAAGVVAIVAVEPYGTGIVNVVYRAEDGRLAGRLVTDNDAKECRIADYSDGTSDAHTDAASPSGLDAGVRADADETGSQEAETVFQINRTIGSGCSLSVGYPTVIGAHDELKDWSYGLRELAGRLAQTTQYLGRDKRAPRV